MAKKLAFVLGGGGGRGALQAGALRALFEAGYRPDLLIGSSAGAINASFLSLYGYSIETLDRLEEAWRAAGKIDLLPGNYIRLTLRAMIKPGIQSPGDQIRDFFIANGITPELRFCDLRGTRVLIVSSDLSTGKPVLHGECETDSVLDALLVSSTLPPWAMPVKKQGHFLMDGAIVSALPIEPALRSGATDIVAFDLMDAREQYGPPNDFGVLVSRLAYAVERREVDLELELAKARGVPVFYIGLLGRDLVPFWDFGHAEELIARGYAIGKKAVEELTILD